MNKDNYLGVDDFKAWNPNMDFNKHSVTVLSGIITRAADIVDEYLNYFGLILRKVQFYFFRHP